MSIRNRAAVPSRSRSGLLSVLAASWMPALLLATGVAEADMRCDGRLISPGDAMAELLLRCGEPTSRSIVGVIRTRDGGSRVLEADVDEWSYPSAGTDPFRVLRFEAGKLVGDGIRCEGGLVREGDTAARVLEICGPPVTRDAAGTRDLPADAADTPLDEDLSDRAEIVVRQWVYDMGEGQFAQIVTLEGGRITSIVEGRRR